MPMKIMACIVLVSQDLLLANLLANDLRIDLAARTNTEAQFNLPPHQSELN